jgi:DNA-binding XRE family transcriptional regulator
MTNLGGSEPRGHTTPYLSGTASLVGKVIPLADETSNPHALQAERLELARELYAAREESGLSQEELAAKLGLSRVQVGRIETGKRSTKPHIVALWFKECGKARSLVGAHRGRELAAALDALDDPADLELFVRLSRLWPHLPSPLRTSLRAQVDVYESSYATIGASGTREPPR